MHSVSHARIATDNFGTTKLPLSISRRTRKGWDDVNDYKVEPLMILSKPFQYEVVTGTYPETCYFVQGANQSTPFIIPAECLYGELT